MMLKKIENVNYTKIFMVLYRFSSCLAGLISFENNGCKSLVHELKFCYVEDMNKKRSHAPYVQQNRRNHYSISNATGPVFWSTIRTWNKSYNRTRQAANGKINAGWVTFIVLELYKNGQTHIFYMFIVVNKKLLYMFFFPIGISNLNCLLES